MKKRLLALSLVVLTVSAAWAQTPEPGVYLIQPDWDRIVDIVTFQWIRDARDERKASIERCRDGYREAGRYQNDLNRLIDSASINGEETQIRMKVIETLISSTDALCRQTLGKRKARKIQEELLVTAESPTQK